MTFLLTYSFLPQPVERDDLGPPQYRPAEQVMCIFMAESADVALTQAAAEIIDNSKRRGCIASDAALWAPAIDSETILGRIKSLELERQEKHERDEFVRLKAKFEPKGKDE
jgi:hypothetical protein